MKRYLIITFTLLTYFSIQSQVHFATTYGKSDIGWNFRIGLEYFPIKNLSIGVGTRIISLLDIDKFDSNVYKDKFYPLSNKEHFGLYLSLNYYILLKAHHIDFLEHWRVLRLLSLFPQIKFDD